MLFLRNPRYRWLVVIASLIYLLSPFDLLPDFFPFLGQIDDFFLLTILVSSFLQNFPKLFAASNPEPEQQKTIDVDATTIE